MTNYQKFRVIKAVARILDGTYAPLMVVLEEFEDAGEVQKALVIKQVIEDITAEGRILEDMAARGFKALEERG